MLRRRPLSRKTNTSLELPTLTWIVSLTRHRGGVNTSLHKIFGHPRGFSEDPIRDNCPSNFGKGGVRHYRRRMAGPISTSLETNLSYLLLGVYAQVRDLSSMGTETLLGRKVLGKPESTAHTESDSAPEGQFCRNVSATARSFAKTTTLCSPSVCT